MDNCFNSAETKVVNYVIQRIQNLKRQCNIEIAARPLSIIVGMIPQIKTGAMKATPSFSFSVKLQIWKTFSDRTYTYQYSYFFITSHKAFHGHFYQQNYVIIQFSTRPHAAT